MKPVQKNKDKTLQQKKDFLFMIFYTNHMVTTKQKSREETQSIKKEETEKKIIETTKLKCETETQEKRNQKFGTNNKK